MVLLQHCQERVGRPMKLQVGRFEKRQWFESVAELETVVSETDELICSDVSSDAKLWWDQTIPENLEADSMRSFEAIA
jgi:hypothetical protein